MTISVAPSLPQENSIVLPYGLKARRFATREPQWDARINILEGAVRSSKTWAMIPKILQLCVYKVRGHRVFFGVSKQTIYNNVLSDLFEIIGPRHYSFNRQTGELFLFGVKWLVIGAKDEGSEKYVRGMTIGVAVGDELTLLPESFVMMLITRLSPAGSRLYATTNPDSPFHYVKEKILDRKEWRESGDVWSEHFTLDDNPNLDETYKRNVRQGYKGVFKLRYIDGLWVMAEGAIYRDCWSEDLLYDDDSRPPHLLETGGHVDRCIAMDYGTTHRNVFLDIIDDGDVIWVEREMVWDSVETQSQKTDSQYADDLEEFLKDAPDAMVIVPPECASFDAELAQRGIWKTDADNEVTDGIRIVSVLMARKKLRVHKRCERLRSRIPAYAWDKKKSERGLEEPIKANDDEVDALRYFAKTRIQSWRLAA